MGENPAQIDQGQLASRAEQTIREYPMTEQEKRNQRIANEVYKGRPGAFPFKLYDCLDSRNPYYVSLPLGLMDWRDNLSLDEQVSRGILVLSKAGAHRVSVIDEDGDENGESLPLWRFCQEMEMAERLAKQKGGSSFIFEAICGNLSHEKTTTNIGSGLIIISQWINWESGREGIENARDIGMRLAWLDERVRSRSRGYSEKQIIDALVGKGESVSQLPKLQFPKFK